MTSKNPGRWVEWKLFFWADEARSKTTQPQNIPNKDKSPVASWQLTLVTSARCFIVSSLFSPVYNSETSSRSPDSSTFWSHAIALESWMRTAPSLILVRCSHNANHLTCTASLSFFLSSSRSFRSSKTIELLHGFGCYARPGRPSVQEAFYWTWGTFSASMYIKSGQSVHASTESLQSDSIFCQNLRPKST